MSGLIRYDVAGLHPRVRRALAARDERAKPTVPVNAFCGDGCGQRLDAVPRLRQDGRCRACRSQLGRDTKRARRSKRAITEDPQPVEWSQ